MAFLADLPSRGNFTRAACVTAAAVPVYLCDHDTRPPDDQVIKTDSTNILIRALSLKKLRDEAAKAKEAKGKAAEESKGKRVAEGSADFHPNKKQNTVEGGGSKYSDKELQSMTVEKLKVLLKVLGASVKGKKDELIARVKQLL